MSGFGALILTITGAFIRWILMGFRKKFKSILNDDVNPIKNDIINISISLLFFLIVALTIQFIFFGN